LPRRSRSGSPEHPDGNGLIIGRRVYARDGVDIFLQVASEDGRDLSGVKILDADRRPVQDIAREIEERAARVRARRDQEVERSKDSLARIPNRLLAPAIKLVGFLTYNLGLDLSRIGVAYDQFGSAMVTSIGSIDAGLGMALAPMGALQPRSIIVLVNNVQRKPIAVGDRVRDPTDPDTRLHVRPSLHRRRDRRAHRPIAARQPPRGRTSA
jgi:pyruvate dehydrogenase E2 component (dihydrolipoamide acetyltransferase)